MKIYIDGGCFPNPGEMAIGIVLENGDILEAKKIGKGTNNIAEYEACLKALEIAEKKGWKEFTLCIDSMLVINQLSGNWKVKNPNFWEYIEKFNKLKDRFDEVNVIFVRSEENLAHHEVEKLLNISDVPMFKFGKGK